MRDNAQMRVTAAAQRSPRGAATLSVSSSPAGPQDTPAAAQPSAGIEMGVNPGSVFTSLMMTVSVSVEEVDAARLTFEGIEGANAVSRMRQSVAGGTSAGTDQDVVHVLVFGRRTAFSGTTSHPAAKSALPVGARSRSPHDLATGHGGLDDDVIVVCKALMATQGDLHGSEMPIEAAHENEPRLAVPSCHGRRRLLNTHPDN